MHLKKNQLVKTPFGEGRIIKFPMLKGFVIGVEVKVDERMLRVTRDTVEQWQVVKDEA